MRTYSGSFSFETLLCNIFNNYSVDEASSSIRENFRAQAAEAGNLYGLDTIVVNPINRSEVSQELHHVLFHERTHFWQLISCPLQQYRFILFLENFGYTVSDNSGDSRKIACYDHLETTTRERIEKCIADVDAHFRVKDINQINMKGFLGPNIIDERTDMPLLLLPHPFSSQYPGYGGVMAFGEDHEPVLVPFTAQNLLESATRIAQDLYKGTPLPKPTHLDSDNAQLYLGAWEFWRRAMGKIYVDEEELALVFLGAVELATTADFLTQYSSHDELYEHVSIAYRFGKIVYKARSMEKFDLSTGTPCERVSAFQREFCRWNGWPTPDDAFRRTAVMLTRYLIWDYPEVANNQEFQECLSRLFSDYSQSPENGWKELKKLWKEMSKFSVPSEPIGCQILKIMLNACIFQIENPGKFALPHLYRDELVKAFPLPLLCKDDAMYWDEDFDADITCRLALPRDEAKLIHDCISLFTLEPLRRGDLKCGFVDQFVASSCCYVNSGFGCPAEGLTNAEKELRRHHDLDEQLCHWTVRKKKLSLGHFSILEIQSENYDEIIASVYKTHLSIIRKNASLEHICQQAGKVYSDIFEINCKLNYWQDRDKYDHTLVFLIAGWIKDNLSTDATDGLTQENLASAITEQSLAYLRARQQQPNRQWENLYYC